MAAATDVGRLLAWVLLLALGAYALRQGAEFATTAHECVICGCVIGASVSLAFLGIRHPEKAAKRE